MATENTESVGAAAVSVWYLWAFAAVATAVAVYFSRREGLIRLEGEWFYTIIFGVAALVAVGYGAYKVRSRHTAL